MICLFCDIIKWGYEKEKNMKKSKVLYLIPGLFTIFLISIFPTLLILKDIKKVDSPYFGMMWVGYLIVLILLSIWLLYQFISLIRFIIKSDMGIGYKILWIFLLVLFNVLIIPYYYSKFVNQDNKIIFRYLFFIIPVIGCSVIFFLGLDKYNSELDRIEAERKAIEAERNYYSTKDNSVTFTFRHGYKTSEVGEYDLYVKNEEEKVVFTAFTYNTVLYDQKTSDEFLSKGINDISANKKLFELYKDKEEKDYSDKVIKTISYKGKTENSALCIYRISVIEFKNVPDYLVYTVEIVTEKNYKKNLSNLDEILASAKKN